MDSSPSARSVLRAPSMTALPVPGTADAQRQAVRFLEQRLRDGVQPHDPHALLRMLRGQPEPTTDGDTHVVPIPAECASPCRIAAEPFDRSPTADELERAVLDNTYYRRVLYTPKARGHQQVAMSVDYWLPPETHSDVDQYFLVKAGRGESIVDGVRCRLRPLSAFWVERGQRHEIRVDQAAGPLKLFVAYTPAHHPRGRIDETNADLAEWLEKYHAAEK